MKPRKIEQATFIRFLGVIVITSILVPPFSSATAAAEKQGSPLLEQQVLFQAGELGYATYRIPSLIVTNQKTVLAFAEGRKNSASDWANIDLVQRRSPDGGRTWTETKIIVDQGELTAGNPCPVVDRSNGTIWLTFALGSKPEQGNAQILLTKSIDDGQTWSQPVDISEMAKNPAWPFAGTGPGHGIQLKTGRLLIPCWADATPRCGEKQFSFCFYSDDHGSHWRLGEPLTLDASDECDVVELADGTVYLNARSRQGKKLRAYAFSKDAGHSWTTVQYDAAQPEPSCDGAVIRLTDASRFQKSRVLVSCPGNPNARDHLTIHLSCDECRTWPVSKVLNPGYSGYSDLAVTDDKAVLCLYETDDCRTITLARFNVEWLTDGKDSLQAKPH